MRPAPLDPVSTPVNDVPLLNVPNALTALRILLVPVLIVLFIVPQTDAVRWWAAMVFVVASITDLLDGAIARSRGLVTSFGKIADPIADKALTGTALIGLSLLGELTWWITIVIIVREIAVTLMRFWVIGHGVIPASRGGKAKTLAQVIAITMYLMPLEGWWTIASQIAMGIAVMLTIVTGIDYAVRARALRHQAPGTLTNVGAVLDDAH